MTVTLPAVFCHLYLAVVRVPAQRKPGDVKQSGEDESDEGERA